MGDGTTSPSDAKIEQLVSTGYLKDIPVGGLSTPGFTNNWYIDETRGAALTFIGTDEGARNICQAARKRLGFTDATKSCEAADIAPNDPCRSEEHTSELQSLMRISYAVFCLKKKKTKTKNTKSKTE